MRDCSWGGLDSFLSEAIKLLRPFLAIFIIQGVQVANGGSMHRVDVHALENVFLNGHKAGGFVQHPLLKQALIQNGDNSCRSAVQGLRSPSMNGGFILVEQTFKKAIDFRWNMGSKYGAE